MKRKTAWSMLMYSCLIVAALSIGVLTPLMLSGCTTITNPDGSTRRVLGFDSPEAQTKAKETVDSAAAVLPFPFNVIVKSVGDIVILGISVYAAKKKGEEIGWDSKVADDKKNSPPPPSAPIPPATTT